jgi:hypothetical protein
MEHREDWRALAFLALGFGIVGLIVGLAYLVLQGLTHFYGP